MADGEQQGIGALKRQWLVEQIALDLDAERQGAIHDNWYDAEEDEMGVDVRLQMEQTEHGICWHLHYGDASYDTDHTGFWGSGVICPDGSMQELADDLVSECEDHAAQCDVTLEMEE